ncbi:MAG: sigma 54-interacting transcriptional regulator, partial [Deltaproteobacteria bacterium]|nr:sigma 54-interacting transcriptional regulator [Deltaproteobacteria bacterium]
APAEELESAGLDARAALVRAELAWRAQRTSEACTLAEDAADRARRARQPEQELRASAFLARAHASLGTGAADVHASSFRRRLGDLAARTPPGLRERFVRRWTETAGLDDVAHTTMRSARAAASHEGLGLAGHRLVSLVRRTLLEADEARLLEAALDEAITASGAERGFLLLARDGKRAEIAVARNLDRDTIKRPRFRMSRSVADRVLATNEPLVTASATEDPELAGSRSILDLGLRSIVCVPVRSPSGVVGALYLDHRFERGRFDTEVSEIAQAFADVVGLALENTRLHRANEARLREAETLRAAAEERASAHLLDADRMAALLASRSVDRADAPGGIVGRTPAIRAAIELVRKVARSDLAICIEGESGTGKELFARLAHDESPRRSGPFLAINCGALPEALLESELFGHVRGAFTGATRDHEGLLRSAHGGTIFLDEVGEMPPSMQVRLLRALQEREVRPVGGRGTISIDVRVVSATHRSLADEIERGTFRRDLYFRLAGVTVSLPPLRERSADVPLLATAILDRVGGPGRRLSRRALARLLAHPFPGNVRELEQALRRACAVAQSDVLEPDDLGLATRGERVARVQRVELTSGRVERALSDAGGNRTVAARALGVSRATLHRFLLLQPPSEPGRRGRPSRGGR